MKRLMTTAATLIALSTTAYAQDSGPFTDYQLQPEQDLLASELMGSSIYGTEGEVSGPVESSVTSEWNNFGEINDMVLSQDGSVEVVVLGIGGFLGIGEQDTAIQMDQLQIVRNSDDPTEYFLVVNATQEQAENAPEFVRDPNAEQPSEGMEQSGGATGMGAGTGMDNAAEDAAGEAAQEAQEAQEAAEEAGQAAEEAGQAAEDATNN